MKKIVYALCLSSLIAFSSCGGADTPEAISKKWCDMTANIDKAEGEEKDKLRKEREEFEESVEAKHKGDDAFMDKVKDLTRACD